MKKVFLVVLAVVIACTVFLFFKGRKMQVITTEIEISAPPEKVWAIIADVNKWQDWSPIINKSSGSVSEGSKLNITMKGKVEGEDGPQYSPTITKLDRPKFFRWRDYMLTGFLFTNDKIFELEASSSGTRLIHKELFKGLLAPLFCDHMETGVPPMLNAMNKALKELAEKPAL